MKKSDIISAPALDHDAMMLREYKRGVSDIGRKDRLVVANLIAHMERRGWRLHSVYDGEETTRVETMKEAMELIFNLDEASLRFYKTQRQYWHCALLVMGNSGWDVVADWNYTDGDPDGFNADMDAFDGEIVLELYNEVARKTLPVVEQLVEALLAARSVNSEFATPTARVEANAKISAALAAAGMQS